MGICLSAWPKPSIPSRMTRHFWAARKALKLPLKTAESQPFEITIKNCRIAAGAGFVVVLTGDIMTMPGLPKVPAAEKIDVSDDGVISGLF